MTGCPRWRVIQNKSACLHARTSGEQRLELEVEVLHQIIKELSGRYHLKGACSRALLVGTGK